MPSLTLNTKVALAVAVICIILSVIWVFLDPLSHFVFLLDVENPVKVDFSELIPVKTIINQNVSIQIPEKFSANAQVSEHLAIPLDEHVELPINLTITAPLEADVQVDQVLDLNFDLPIDARIPNSFPVSITIKDRLPVSLEASLASDVKIDGTVPIELGTLRIKKGSVHVKVE